MLRSLVLISALVMSLGAFAQEDECSNLMESRGNVTVRRNFYPDGACNLSVTAGNPGDIYRDYSFGHTGGILIFVNYGVYDGEHRFGTREFFLLPNKNKFPQFAWNDETSQLEVIMTNGKKAFFNYSDAELSGIEGANITVNSRHHPHELGGVNITIKEGLLVDTGFLLDRLNSQSPTKMSVIQDAEKNSCKVMNMLLFGYKSNGDVVFKLSNEELSKLVSTKCPALKY